MTEDCPKSINPDKDWAEVRGFDQRRRGGGTNAIALREPTGRYLCDDCMRRLKLGLDTRQGAMF